MILFRMLLVGDSISKRNCGLYRSFLNDAFSRPNVLVYESSYTNSVMEIIALFSSSAIKPSMF